MSSMITLDITWLVLKNRVMNLRSYNVTSMDSFTNLRSFHSFLKLCSYIVTVTLLEYD